MTTLLQEIDACMIAYESHTPHYKELLDLLKRCRRQISPLSDAGQLRAESFSEGSGSALEFGKLYEAARNMVDAYQPHVMAARCRVCNLAWQKLKETL